jgi:hypothetical protein
VKTYALGSLAEMLAFVNEQCPTAFEGIVARDRAYRRVKVKNASYLAYNRIVGAAANSPRALLEVILHGQHDDVFPILRPDLRATGERYLASYRVLAGRMDADYERLHAETCGDPNPRKAMALAIQRERLWLPPLMTRWAGKCESFAGFLESNKKAGTWQDSFLDALLEQLGERQRGR